MYHHPLIQFLEHLWPCFLVPLFRILVRKTRMGKSQFRLRRLLTKIRPSPRSPLPLWRLLPMSTQSACRVRGEGSAHNAAVSGPRNMFRNKKEHLFQPSSTLSRVRQTNDQTVWSAREIRSQVVWSSRALQSIGTACSRDRVGQRL